VKLGIVIYICFQRIELNPKKDTVRSSARCLNVCMAPNLSRSESPYTSIVYLLHGIRADQKEWMDKMQESIKAAKAYPIACEYGRISAVRFAFPWVRRRQVRWFQDSYAQLLAEYPDTPFHFFGHSNGTYILGHALRRLPGMRFDRIALTGCVLPRDYDWNACLVRGQVQQVWNHCASDDFPVAVLCQALGALGTDLGTAGSDGFDGQLDGLRMRNVRYYRGGHSAAIQKKYLPFFSKFLISADPALPSDIRGDEALLYGKLSRVVGASLNIAVRWFGLPLLCSAFLLLYSGSLISSFIWHWLKPIDVPADLVAVAALLLEVHPAFVVCAFVLLLLYGLRVYGEAH
jgi:pimeloyl-ACP methyl ester carboxylesterase